MVELCTPAYTARSILTTAVFSHTHEHDEIHVNVLQKMCQKPLNIRTNFALADVIPLSEESFKLVPSTGQDSPVPSLFIVSELAHLESQSLSPAGSSNEPFLVLPAPNDQSIHTIPRRPASAPSHPTYTSWSPPPPLYPLNTPGASRSPSSIDSPPRRLSPSPALSDTSPIPSLSPSSKAPSIKAKNRPPTIIIDWRAIFDGPCARVRRAIGLPGGFSKWNRTAFRVQSHLYGQESGEVVFSWQTGVRLGVFELVRNGLGWEVRTKAQDDARIMESEAGCLTLW